MKVCSLYGAGFYYIPGTDICMKVGGYVRWQQTFNPGSSISGGPLLGIGGRSTRLDSQDFAQRTRAVATFDTRQQTAYGTLRTYLLLGYSQDSTSGPTTSPAVYMTRGFIQIAGFTFGKATSFFDFTSTAAVAYNAGMLHNSDTGDAGQMVAAYTAQFGNGLSATISAEQTRRAATVDLNGGGSQFNLGTLDDGTCNNNAGLAAPGATCNVGQQDIVGNIRIDQAWGSAQISGALHDASAGYFGATESGGHPDSKWGFAVSGGLRLNAPMIGPGDYFQVMAIYSEGATGYLSQTSRSAAMNKWDGNTVGYGFWSDGVYTTAATAGGTGGEIELTTGWSMFASYEHFWTPALRSSLYGSYVEQSYSGNAKSAICATQGGANSAFQGGAGCNPDWSAWAIGSRTQWNITKDLYVGLDVIYLKLNSASTASGLLTAASGAKPADVYQVADQDAFAATWRIHRDIVP